MTAAAHHTTGAFEMEIAILALVIFGVAVVIGSGIILIQMMASVKRSTAANRRLAKMLAQLLVLAEEDARKNRHAIKTMAAALRMQSVIEEMEKAEADTGEIETALVDRVAFLAEDQELAAS